MAITSTFSSGQLTTVGDGLDNAIATSRDLAGSILVNGGTVVIQGGSPTVSNTSLIQVFGQAGNDSLTIDESNGPLPAARLFGGTGKHTLAGSAATASCRTMPAMTTSAPAAT